MSRPASLASVTNDSEISRCAALTIGPSCSGCHSGGSPAGGLGLGSESVAYTNLLDGYVVPGDPDDSELWERITATGYTRMPPDETLAIDRLAEVSLWISGGALE